ncbi:hypothetical protein [Methylomicrobium agile]|uniref:hypothetical protein n=1 Tax=Methylomicrobium agile TaxID=39774 RepID=UPI0004DF77E7|nr:hypothetical protein [Methylomicrobium agile]
MADHVTANPGSGGPTFATDEIGGVHYPISKIAHGADDSATPVSTSDPLPVFVPPVSPINISGTITTGGTAQQLAASNLNRRGWSLRNNSEGSLWVSDVGTADYSKDSLEIKPGELYETPYGGQSSGAISIIGQTTGQSFTAREW